MSKHKKQIIGTRSWNRVSIKKKLAASNGYSFSTCYMDLCRQQRVRPLPVICVSLPNSLEFTPDRVKMDEWGPILTSLSLDRVLRSIRIHSRYQNRKPLENVTSENKARKVDKTPLVLTRYILERLSHSVAQCVRYSSNLTCLELEGIPLTSDCVAVLCVGISSSKSLQYLSLCKSYIGDSGCELICQTITTTRCIKSLNLSQCNLSSRCGTALATALSRQKLSLYHDTWKQSLRYRQPNFENMPGLRRLTLNGNPQLGNSATNKIIDAVRDSLWIKALDLQNCGLTKGIGNEILDLINRNSTLVVVDVRLNINLDERIVDEIMRKLEKNNEDFNIKSEYKWIGLPRKRISRAASAHLRKSYPDKQESLTRTTSASAQQSTKRQIQAVSARRTPPTPIPVTTKKTKMKPQSSDDESTTKEEPKASLHIDLQAQMISKSDASSVAELHELVQSRRGLETESTNNDLTAQSTPEALKVERNTLLEKINNLDLLLNEERLRRKLAEEKLHSMKRSVVELENALKKKEQEMKGYVLVSQDSLDEICVSFDQLLEILYDLTKAQKTSREEHRDGVYDMDGIREWMTTLIRRTKSEGTRRRQFNDVPNTPKKFVKSESNFRSIRSNAINIPIHLERNIGDSPDALTPSVANTLRESSRRKLSTTIGRTRAIFTQLINGDSALNCHEFQY